MNWIIKQRPSSEAIWKKNPSLLRFGQTDGAQLKFNKLNTIETYFINVTDPE